MLWAPAIFGIPAVMAWESWAEATLFHLSCFAQGILSQLRKKKLSVVVFSQFVMFGRVCLSDRFLQAAELGQRLGVLASQAILCSTQQFIIIPIPFPQQHQQIISAKQIRKEFSFNPECQPVRATSVERGSYLRPGRLCWWRKTKVCCSSRHGVTLWRDPKPSEAASKN